jgi:hypothetical protein
LRAAAAITGVLTERASRRDISDISAAGMQKMQN